MSDGPLPGTLYVYRDAAMMRSLDFDRAMRARFENGRHADHLMTDIRKAIQAIEYGKPLTEDQRRALAKLRWRLANTLDDLLEDDHAMTAHRAAAPAVEPERVGTFTQVGVPAIAVTMTLNESMMRQRLNAIKTIVAGHDASEAAADVFKQKDAAE